MGEQNWLELMNRQMGLKQIQETNQYTEKYGLRLSETEAELLLTEKNHTLKVAGSNVVNLRLGPHKYWVSSLFLPKLF